MESANSVREPLRQVVERRAVLSVIVAATAPYRRALLQSRIIRSISIAPTIRNPDPPRMTSIGFL
jgi:hypothetical protein